MLFDREFDEVLCAILKCNNKNSLEIAKFIKNLPAEFLNMISHKLNDSNDDDMYKDFNFNDGDSWLYSCKIKFMDKAKFLIIEKYLDSHKHPSFSLCLKANYNSKLNRMANNSTRYLGKSTFYYNGKIHITDYSLKKLTCEYLITNENHINEGNSYSKYHNIISLMDVKSDLNNKDICTFIKIKTK